VRVEAEPAGKLPRVLPSLTGLRALAAGLVFFRHTEYLFNGTSVAHWAWRLFVQGGVGVSFFFVLSGFVLTWSARGGARSFYRRRFARIYPAYAVAWLLGGAVAVYVGAPVTLGIALACLLLLQAWIPHQDYFIGMNGVSWSLSCEAFFYAIFPLLIFGLVRAHVWLRWAALLVCMAGVIAIPTYVAHTPSDHQLWLAYIFPPTRALEFVCGIILALEVGAGRWPSVPLALAWPFAIFGYLVAGEAGLQPGTWLWWLNGYYGYAAATIVPFIVLIGAYATRDVAGAPSVFARRIAIRLGEWSYCFYLVHFLVIQVFEKLTLGWQPNVVSAIFTMLSLLVVSLALAGTLHLYVERPWERRLRGARQRPTAELESRGAAA
jgi:peptidoglycan/LPS O-acetylase OafA/YrhL